MLVKLDAEYKDIQADYETEADIDKLYLWGVDHRGIRKIIMAGPGEEMAAVASAITFALQDRDLTRGGQSGDKS